MFLTKTTHGNKQLSISRRYIAEILPKLRKTIFIQSINQSIFLSEKLAQFDLDKFKILYAVF